MNEKLAKKFVAALAECATTGNSTGWRKEAASKRLVKSAFDPIGGVSGYLYAPLIGAAVGGGAGYLSSKDQKKKLRDALYGASVGGLTGLGSQFISEGVANTGKPETNPMQVSINDPAIAKDPDVQATAAALAASAPNATKPEIKDKTGPDAYSRALTDSGSAVLGAVGGERLGRGLGNRLAPGRAGELRRLVDAAPVVNGQKSPAIQALSRALDAVATGRPATEALGLHGANPNRPVEYHGGEPTPYYTAHKWRNRGASGNAPIVDPAIAAELEAQLANGGNLGNGAGRAANLRRLEDILIEQSRAANNPLPARSKWPKPSGIRPGELSLQDLNKVRTGGGARGALRAGGGLFGGIGLTAIMDALNEYLNKNHQR